MDRIERPKTARSRKTRAAILDAAWTLLEERGAEGLAMVEVARRAGVSRRAIYLHFASKSELYLALRDHIDEELDLATSLRPVVEAPDALQALRAWSRHLAGYHPHILSVLRAIDHARRTDEAAAALWEDAMEMWHRGCRELTSRLVEEGRLADGWTQAEAADLLWALMSADLLEDLTEDRGWSHERYGEGLFLLASRTLVRKDEGRASGGGAGRNQRRST